MMEFLNRFDERQNYCAAQFFASDFSISILKN